jgi:GNAT superfamily N-acetyltransferase
MGAMNLIPPRPLIDADQLDGFNCGVPSLDAWLTQPARRAQRGHTAETYLVIDADTGQVAGYYCLSSYLVSRAQTSSWLARNTPDPIPTINTPGSVPTILRDRNTPGLIPTVLLGRLAVDTGYQGFGLGAALLRDAVLRAVQAQSILGVKALIVDALDESAAAFYLRHMFKPFPADSLRLFHRL